MSFSSVGLVPAPDGTSVVVSTIDGSTLPSHAEQDRVLPVALGVWGVGAGGRAYFDPTGASTGEMAVLGFDVNGGGSGVAGLFLETATDPAVMDRAGPPRQALQQRERRRAEALVPRVMPTLDWPPRQGHPPL